MDILRVFQDLLSEAKSGFREVSADWCCDMRNFTS